MTTWVLEAHCTWTLRHSGHLGIEAPEALYLADLSYIYRLVESA